MKNAVQEAVFAEMKMWGKLIASVDIADPLIFGRQISAFSSLWKYMKDEPEMIPMISKVRPFKPGRVDCRRFAELTCLILRMPLVI